MMDNCIKSVAHIAFLLKLISKNDLETWAFQMIERGNQDDFFLNIATSYNDKDILSALGEIDNKDCTQFFVEYFLGYFKVFFEVKLWIAIVEKILSFSRIVDISEIDEGTKIFMIRLKDDYELRKEGFGGSMDMPEDLIDFLKNFSNFLEYQEQLDKVSFPKMILR